MILWDRRLRMGCFSQFCTVSLPFGSRLEMGSIDGVYLIFGALNVACARRSIWAR